MKIKLDELKTLYRDYIRSQTAPSRLHCPSLEIIYYSLKGKCSRRQRTRLINHISHCHFCLDDFDILRSILSNERAILDGIAQVFPEDTKRKIGLKKESNGYRQKKKYMLVYSRRVMFISLAMLATAFLTVGLLTNHRFLKKFLFSDQNRSFQIGEFVLLQPECNKEYTIPALIFKWRSFPRPDYYTLELFDDTLLPIWKSSAIFEPSYSFSSESSEFLKPHKKYYWIVSAYKSSRIQFESKIGCFYLK